MKSSHGGQRLFAGLAVTLALSVGSASAQDTTPAATPAAPSGLSLELNTASDVDGGCRLAFVAFNGTETAMEAVSYEVVAFDRSQIISQVMLFDFGALPLRKTRIVRFDIANAKCADISRLVINGAVRCEAAGAASPICLDAAAPTSRTSIALSL